MRKCELAGIFYSCEYVHRAVLATLQSASAPYLKALTNRPSRDLALFHSTFSNPLPCLSSRLPSHPIQFLSFFSSLKGCVPHPWGGGEENELLHRCPTLRLLSKKKRENLSNLLCLNATRYKGKLSWRPYANSQIWRQKNNSNSNQSKLFYFLYRGIFYSR